MIVAAIAIIVIIAVVIVAFRKKTVKAHERF
jgi:hypothetical protein